MLQKQLCKKYTLNKNFDMEETWINLSQNKSDIAIDILENNIDKIMWVGFCSNKNPRVMDIVGNNLKVCCNYGYKYAPEHLLKNPNVIILINKKIIDRNFVDNVKDGWKIVMKNPALISFIEKNMDKVEWKELSCNPNAIELIEKNLDKVNWTSLSRNPNAIHILEKNVDKISWFTLSENPNAINILQNNVDKIEWINAVYNPNIMDIKIDNIEDKLKLILNVLCSSSDSRALEIVERNLDILTISFDDFFLNSEIDILCRNEYAIDLLKRNFNINRITRSILMNPNGSDIIKLIIEECKNNNNVSKYWKDTINNTNIFCYYLSMNPDISKILRNIEINNIRLSSFMCKSHHNIHLFTTIDYKKMHEINKEYDDKFNEELVAYVFNPNRLLRFGKKYNFQLWDIDDIY